MSGREHLFDHNKNHNFSRTPFGQCAEPELSPEIIRLWKVLAGVKSCSKPLQGVHPDNTELRL